MKVSALIPAKRFRNAKQRLGTLLPCGDREALAQAMFRDVLRAAVAAPGLTGTYVVTADDEVAATAASLAARVIREPAERGETDAVNFARDALQKIGCEAVLIIPGDVPLVRSADIDAVLAQVPARAESGFALLVPSHDRMGTNALLLAPPDIIKLRFGYDSFSFHSSQVSARGLPLRFIENERIALDIDEPKDLQRLLSFPDESQESVRLAKAMLAQYWGGNVRGSGGV
jgi:2-phospho-L-lactate guanylyltransferase